MDRRKFIIGVGALGAGTSAALGTGAFTTVQAQRNADISIVGDSNAYLQIQSLGGANADEYVTQENDGTYQLQLPKVNQDAVTEVEDLLRVVNQGTQSVSVYFVDDSDAVTFHVTRSGRSIEGSDNSVELGVGEQVVVGLTVDTLNNDVKGQLLDSVTVHADATASAPKQDSGPQPQYVVDPASDSGAGDAANVFQSVQAAIDAAEAGATIGIKDTGAGQAVLEPSSDIVVDKSGITLTGYEGSPKIDATTNSLPKSDDEVVHVAADGVTIQNLDIDYDGSGDLHAISGIGRTGITVDGLTITSSASTDTNAIDIRGGSLEITNNEVTDAGIQVQHGGEVTSGPVTITGNNIEESDGGSGGIKDEGIVGFSLSDADLSNHEYEVRDNRVRDTGSEEDVKLVNLGTGSAPSVNGLTGGNGKDLAESIVTQNDVSSANVVGATATQVTPQLSAFSTIQDAIDAAGSGGVTVVESGSYTESVAVDENNFRLKGIGDPTIEGEGANTGSQPHATIQVAPDTTETSVEGFTIRNPDGYYGVYVGSGSGSQDIDQNEVRGNTIERISTNVDSYSPSPLAGGAAGVYVRGDHDNGVTVENNIIQNVDTTGSSVNATGISLKSLTVTGDVPATGATVKNNLVRNIAGGGRNKGISVNGDYDGARVLDNTINGLTGDNSAAALKAITINQNKRFAPTADPDRDGDNEWIGPTNFEVKRNEIRQVSGVPSNSWGIAVGNYEELDSTVSNYPSSPKTSKYKGIKNNNVLDTNLTVGIGRYNADEGGVNPEDTDTVQLEGNYYGTADGPSGEDVDGTLSGSGAVVTTVDFGEGNDSRVKVVNYSTSPNSDAGSSL